MLPEDQPPPGPGVRSILVVLSSSVLLVATAALLQRPPRAPSSPPENPCPPQSYATDSGADALAALADWVPGKLPEKLDPRQRRAPCDADLEVTIAVNGVNLCWIPLALEKCPEAKGKAWMHEGRCYGRALEPEKPPERPPTSQEPTRAPGVADPTDR